MALYGDEEKQIETWKETEELVRVHIGKDLDMDVSKVSIGRAQRMSSKEKPRPVIEKVSFYIDR